MPGGRAPGGWRGGGRNEAKGGALRRRAAGSQGMGGALEAAGTTFLRADVVLQPNWNPSGPPPTDLTGIYNQIFPQTSGAVPGQLPFPSVHNHKLRRS